MHKKRYIYKFQRINECSKSIIWNIINILSNFEILTKNNLKKSYIIILVFNDYYNNFLNKPTYICTNIVTFTSWVSSFLMYSSSYYIITILS